MSSSTQRGKVFTAPTAAQRTAARTVLSSRSATAASRFVRTNRTGFNRISSTTSSTSKIASTAKRTSTTKRAATSKVVKDTSNGTIKDPDGVADDILRNKPPASFTQNPAVQKRMQSPITESNTLLSGTPDPKNPPTQPKGGLQQQLHSSMEASGEIPKGTKPATAKEFSDDLANLDKPATALKTPAGKKFKEILDAEEVKRTPARPSLKDVNKAKTFKERIMKFGKVVAVLGLLGGVAAVVGMSIKWAQDNTGCYQFEPGDEEGSIMCVQTSCAIGSTCGSSNGKCQASGTCCAGASAACSENSTCKCVEKSFVDGLKNTMDSITDGIKNLLDMFGDIWGQIIGFIKQYLPLILIGLFFGSIIFFFVWSRLKGAVLGGGDPGTQTVRVVVAAPPPLAPAPVLPMRFYR